MRLPRPFGLLIAALAVASALAQGSAKTITVCPTCTQTDLRATIERAAPGDRIVVRGEPPLDVMIRGGVHGDVATSAILLNSIQALREAEPGLHTMATIPMASCRRPLAVP